MEAATCHANLSTLLDDGSALCSSSQDDITVDGDRDTLSGSCSECRSAPTSSMWWVRRHELRMKLVMSISIGASSSQTLFTASSTSCRLTRHPAVRLWYNPVTGRLTVSTVNRQATRAPLSQANCLTEWHHTGHFGDVLPSQSLGLVMKKMNQTQQKQTCICNKIRHNTKQTQKN